VTQSDHLESNDERRDGNELERAAIGGCGVAASTVIGSSRSSWRSRRGGTWEGAVWLVGSEFRSFDRKERMGEMGQKRIGTYLYVLVYILYILHIN
jgi:hypothetical protein